MKRIRIWVWACCVFFVSNMYAQVTQQVTALQYYYDTDPGTGIAGNGAILPVTPTGNLDQTFVFTLPGAISDGFHYLYSRVKDEYGRWSMAERRMFYVSAIANGTRNIVSYQYYFDTDLGVGVAGTGGIVPVSSTADLNSTVAIAIPNLSNGIHQLYIRVKDDLGRWSIAERRSFFVSTVVSGPRNIVAYQYYFDTDPGVNVVGNGGIVPVSSTGDLNTAVAISLPTLDKGIHQLYIRTKDDLGRWSIAERRMFYISDVVGNTRDLTSLEYYFDVDPGVKNANPIPITATGDFNQTVALGVPCLSAGTHYFYLRAKDNLGRWSIAERDTLTITSGITASVISPAGPLSLCSGNSVILSTPPVPGITYQWVESGVPIPGATNPSLTVNTAGSYALRTICGSFVLSNVVVVTALPLLTYYADADNDGYGNIAVMQLACVQPSGYVLDATDCDDTNASIHPNAIETCNLIDDDCDGLVDEGVQTTFYADADSDGYGNAAVTQLACTAPSGYVANDDDCDDTNSSVHPGATETCNLLDDNCNGIVDEGVQFTFYADTDGDGYGNASSSLLACTQPAGYVTNAGDCNDTNANIHPGGTEVCNLLDDDCDGLVDEDVQSIFYADADNDGYGNAAVTTMACTAPSGYVSNNQDCNDSNAAVHPGATETCNLIDDDCDGLIDENVLNIFYADTDNDGYGDASSTIEACLAPSGYVNDHTDCDDSNAAVHPGATEICNGIDDDCDGLIDEGVKITVYADADGDGYGNPAVSQLVCTIPSGYVTNNTDCNDNASNVHPGAIEICNNIDDNCNGVVDEGVKLTFYADVDGDGYGNPAASIMACAQPGGYVTNNTDCNDGNANVHPGAVEICNGLDDNCDGTIDEGFTYSLSANSILSSNGNIFCAGTSTMLTITGGLLGSSADWLWYEGGCGAGPASIGSGTSISVNPSAGIHTYYVRAESGCNVTACVSIEITVQSAPVFLSCPGNINVNNEISICGKQKTYPIATGGLPAADLSYTFSGATIGNGSGTGSGLLFNVGNTNVSVLAENVCGTATCDFDVTVNDTQAPIIQNCPGDLFSVTEEGQGGAHMTWDEPTAFDNCALLSLTSSMSPGDFFLIGETEVVYTATDIHNNTSTCSFTVNVTLPDIIGDVNLSIFANDIQLSDPLPAPNSNITVSATVHNTSNVNAGPFVCRLLNLFTGLYSADINLPSLAANQNTTVTWSLTTPPIPAFVPLQVFIDATDVIVESNELDNQAIRPFINGTVNLPGKIVVVVDPISTVPANTNIFICGHAYYEDTALTLEDSSVAGAQLKFTINETSQVIMGATNSTGHFCIPYVTPNTPGLYHFNAEVTDFTLVGDTTGTFQLLDPVITCPKDLSLTMELMGPFLCGNQYNIAKDSALTGVVHVYNNCEAITDAFQVMIYLPDGSPVPGPYTINGMSPGEVQNIFLPAMTFSTVGTTFIRATVDATDVVHNEIENNNSKTIFIQVHPPLPDFEGMNGKVSDFACHASVIQFEIKNQGGIPSGPFNASLEVYNGNTLESTLLEPVASIPALCSEIVYFDLDPVSAGQYYFHLICDPGLLVEEVSESNNEYIFPHYFYACKEDLIVRNECGQLDVKNANPAVPTLLTLTATVANIGTVMVTDPYIVNFEIEGTNYPVLVTTPLGVNASKYVSVTIPSLPNGSHTLNVTVDSEDDIPESDEGNNTSSFLLGWDFQLTNIRCDGLLAMSTPELICHPDTIETRLINTGFYEASNVMVKFEISGPGLPAGWNSMGTVSTSVDQTCSCPIPVIKNLNYTYPQAGTYSIKMTVDPNNVFPETNEANNQLIVSVQVLSGADYAVYSQYIAPSTLNPALLDPVSISLTYKNVGCTTIAGSELYSQVDGVSQDSVMAGSLAPGATNTYLMPHTWSTGLPGIHVLREVIDHDHTVAEINELNNEATRTIIAGKFPDLDVFVVNGQVSGDVVTITTSFTNDGELGADGILQLYVVGDDLNEILIHQEPIHLAGHDTLTRSAVWLMTSHIVRVIARVGNSDPVEYNFFNNEKQKDLEPLVVNVTRIDVPCSDITLGKLKAVVTGGLPPYYILWSTGYAGDSINVPSGTFAVTVTDAMGNRVEHLDTIMDLALSVLWYKDLDNDGFGNPAVTLIACVQPTGYVGTGTDCNDNLATVYPGAPELPDGKDNDCDGQIDEGVNNLNVDAGDCQVVYLGYGPSQCTNLTVNVTGGTAPYTYSWSTGAQTQTINVCPTTAKIYTVVVTDHNGFTAQDHVTVQVVDIRCGNNNNKVLICHVPPGNPQNTQVLCVAPSAVPAHLAHGDNLGICDPTDPCDIIEDPMQINTPETNYLDEIGIDVVEKNSTIDSLDQWVEVFPNPADDQLMFMLPGKEIEYSIAFMDLSGKIVLTANLQSGQSTLSTATLADGMYLLHIRSAGWVITKGLVIMH
jgi:subtilase family serine protease